MFYCEECRIKNKWPEAFSRSHGKCECCDKVTRCHDRPSSTLPPVRRTPAEPAPASTGRPDVITLRCGSTLRFEARTTGEPGWLLYSPKGKLAFGLSRIDTDMIEATIKATRAGACAARELDVEAERHLAAVAEAAQTLESGAAHNESKGRTVLVHTQKGRAARLRAAHAYFAARSAVQGTAPEHKTRFANSESAALVSTEQAGDAEDTARLNFMIEHEAWIAWSRDAESCRVFHHDEEGDTGPIMGWVPEAWSNSPRDAIDKARALFAPSPNNSPVGGKD